MLRSKRLVSITLLTSFCLLSYYNHPYSNPFSVFYPSLQPSSITTTPSSTLHPLFQSFLQGSYTLPPSSLHQVAVCTMINGEDRFLTEWLWWHRAMGITQFYIYDQVTQENDGEETLDALSSFIQGGLVTYHRVSNREFHPILSPLPHRTASHPIASHHTY